MTWPTSQVSTTNLDAGTDSPALARAQIKTAVDNVNSIAAEFGNVDITGATEGQYLRKVSNVWVGANVSVPTATSQLTNDSGFITTNQSITVSGDVTGSGTTAITATLANTAVTAGTYGSALAVPQIVIDSKGRITSASNVSISAGGSGTSTGTAYFTPDSTSFSFDSGTTYSTYSVTYTLLDAGGTGITISSGNLTVGSGTYIFEMVGKGVGSGSLEHRPYVQLWNNTDSASLSETQGLTQGSKSGPIFYSDVSGGMRKFTLSGSKTLQLRYKNSTTNFTDFDISNLGFKITKIA